MNRWNAGTGGRCAASGPVLGSVAGRKTGVAKNADKRFNVYDTL